MEILDKLKLLSQPFADPQLPTEADIKNAEEKLGVKFPPSYVKYQLQYSEIIFGTLELYTVKEDGSYLDLIQEVEAARQYHELPDHLLPFVAEQDGDYHCFNLRSPGPEYAVEFWSHNGITDEKWDNFSDWVERCWIGEHTA